MEGVLCGRECAIEVDRFRGTRLGKIGRTPGAIATNGERVDPPL